MQAKSGPLLSFATDKELFCRINSQKFLSDGLHVGRITVTVNGDPLMVRAVLCPTGFGGGEDALWEAGGSVTVHHRGRLHALSQPSSHHPTLRHCTQLAPHAGKGGTPPSLLIVGDAYVLGRLYSFLFQCTTRCMNCSRLHCGA